ncbi:MAG: hypothetical protein MJK04_26535 [Psychrosphaera sp.]|nr:hypothetical protein [Psychrosphaera sp.]
MTLWLLNWKRASLGAQMVLIWQAAEKLAVFSLNQGFEANEKRRICASNMAG